MRNSSWYVAAYPAVSVLFPYAAMLSQGYYRSAHALARLARQMSRQLWRPATESDGIPLDVLVNIMTLLNEWKDEHLQRVGVPSNFAAEWDFVSAVSACTYTVVSLERNRPSSSTCL